MVQSTPECPALVIDHATHSIRFCRRCDAPCSRVFEAWTQPEQVRLWWDPAGQPLASCEIDLRPGGTFSFVAQGHPDRPFSGSYIEVVPAQRLVFEAMGAIGTVQLDEAPGGTRLTVEIRCPSAADLHRFLQFGVDKGTTATLDNLVGYLRRP